MSMKRIPDRRVLSAALLAIVALVAPAVGDAATSNVSAAGFLVTLQQEVKANPHRVYEALGEVDKWWNSQHTYSGNAANLSLQAQASACFCERWDGNSVEHGRVVYAVRDSALRIQGALGPLQAMAVNAVLTFTLEEKRGRTMLQLTYRVSGNETSGLQELAAPVDQVLGEALQRLVDYIETGKPQ
jgi:uncharacterized protein YndB with AHSA1/START domain